ncbi:MAG: hypothetical protein QOG31_1403 [Thermoplasmata archaeon]|jgi:hypothetical protein|nr:hypothetical protein [Thermoplasmata archaeon]
MTNQRLVARLASWAFGLASTAVLGVVTVAVHCLGH